MIKNPFNLKCLKIFSLIFFLSFFTTDLYSQCAGTSNSFTICLKETYNEGFGLGQVNLFNHLLGTPTAGGTWMETTPLPCQLAGGTSLNTLTGMLNTWAIRRGCVYQYTYSGCGDGSTSTVTITLGGYPGVGTDGNACMTDDKVNLFTFLGSAPNPDALEDLTSTPPLTGGHFTTTAPLGTIDATTGEFNATLDQVGVPYTFTYSVPGVGTCGPRSTSFQLTIQPKPDAGTPVTPDLHLCENDDLSAYANFDIRTLITLTDLTLDPIHYIPPTPADPYHNEGETWDWRDITTPANGGPAAPAIGLSPNPNPETDTFINIPAILAARWAFLANSNHLDQDLVLTFKYTVNPRSLSCQKAETTFTITIERVIDLNGGNITVAPVGVCQNDATTTPIVMTIHENPLYPVEDGTYDITYDLTGPNEASAGGDATVPVTFSGGTGDITLNLVNPVVAGTTQLCITNAVENSSAVTPKCSRTITGVCADFVINAAPDPSDTQVSVADICFGNTATANISDISGSAPFELINGNYDIDYTIDTVPGSANVTITNGAGSFPIAGSPVGIHNIVLTLFTNTLTTCASVPTTISDTFEVFANPDATAMTINVPDVCAGNSATATVNGITPAGTYDITYTVIPGGPINAVATSVNGSGGTIDLGVLAVGTYTITTSTVLNTTTGCSTISTATDTFTVNPIPDTTAMTVDVVDTPSLCAGNTVNAIVNGINPAGTYDINYTLNGVPGFAPGVIVPGGTINLGNLPAGTYTITTGIVTNTATNCSTTSNATDTFTISPLPIITSSNVLVNDICLGSNEVVTITGLADGTYSIDSHLSGANGPSPRTDIMIISGGTGNTITIPATSLTVPGATTVIIDMITNTTTGCIAVLSGVQATFNVNPPPVINQGELTVADVCFGNNATGTITNALGLTNGSTYTITYNLSSPPVTGAGSITTVIAGNSGTFDISGLTVSGPVTITITDITNNTTGCSTTGLSVTANFTVIAAADVTPATVTVTPNPDICANTLATVNIFGATMLTPGAYTLEYDITGGFNDVNDVSASVNIDASGQGSFTIPAGFPNAGSTTISLNTFVSVSGGCPSVGQMVPYTFNVVLTPEPTLAPGGNIFCIVDGPTLADLSLNMIPNSVITWYDAMVGGTLLPDTTLLVQDGIYYASLTANGCVSESRTQVVVDLTNCPDASINIPDGFSPNGDGMNEEFEIRFIDVLYPGYKLEIYNRYGSMVYKGDINTPKFNGKPTEATVMGQDVAPVGIYFYILYYNDAANTKPVQGRLYLSR